MLGFCFVLFLYSKILDLLTAKRPAGITFPRKTGIYIKKILSWDTSYLVLYLPITHAALGLSHRTTFKKMPVWRLMLVTPAAGGSDILGHPQVHSEFKNSLGCLRPCLQNEQNSKNTKPRNSHSCWWITVCG